MVSSPWNYSKLEQLVALGGIIKIHNSIDESQKIYIEWKKPNLHSPMPRLKKKRTHSVWFHLYKTLEKTNYRNRKQTKGCLGIGQGKGRL